LKQRTFAKAQRMADAASARLPASLLVRPAAVLQISSARARKANNLPIRVPPFLAAFLVYFN